MVAVPPWSLVVAVGRRGPSVDGPETARRCASEDLQSAADNGSELQGFRGNADSPHASPTDQALPLLGTATPQQMAA